MATLEIQGKTFEVDGDGFLIDPSIWNEDVAKLFAEADGITELNDIGQLSKSFVIILKKRGMPRWFVPSARRPD